MAVRRTPSQLLYMMLAYGCVGFGAAGVIVPLLPTTPFLLVAAWAATRSSPRLRWWLLRHPRYGPSIRAWQRHRAIPFSAKLTACLLLVFSWVTLWVMGMDGRILAGLTVFFLAVATFILTRPSGSAGNRTVTACQPLNQ
jgi:uncharacterized protein